MTIILGCCISAKKWGMVISDSSVEPTRAIPLVSLASHLATQEARSDTNTFVIKAPATIVMKGSIEYSRLKEQFWIWPIARRTMGSWQPL